MSNYIDWPTKKAINHYNECKKYYNEENFKFSDGIQKDYYSEIQNETPDFSKISYINIGLWDKKDTLKFYKQTNANYVSQSLIENMFTDKYDIVNVDSLKNIMSINNHNKIDLLKLNIEGAEIKVIEQMLKDDIYPKYLLIEFDLLIQKKDNNNLTKELILNLFKHNYKLLKNDNLNMTFVHQC